MAVQALMPFGGYVSNDQALRARTLGEGGSSDRPTTKAKVAVSDLLLLPSVKKHPTSQARTKQTTSRTEMMIILRSQFGEIFPKDS